MKKVTIAQQLKIKKFPFIIPDHNGNEIYYEDSSGFWIRREKDEKGNQTFSENSYGTWWKREFDSKGNSIYYENSDGYWFRREFDSNGNEIYYENETGTIIDNRPKVSEVHITMADIKDSIYKAASADFIISIQRTTPLKEIELTMDEIAKALNIDVNLLKIKK
jgi:hypothetical protein